MTLYETLAFALFALVTVASSLGVVLARDVWHSALFLGGALLSVAIHFVMLEAEFLAAMQVLVYVGGVLILITFAVMLTREEGGATTGESTGGGGLRDVRPDGGRPDARDDGEVTE